MERLPLLQCTWREWVELHPDTEVPDGNGESREGHGERHAPGSPIVRKHMLEMVQHVDSRLPHYELVLGVLVQSHSRCYPLTALPGGDRVLNDTLGGEDIAVFWQPESWMAIAYRRRLDGQCLVFRTQGEAIVDEQTNSRWEISGIASSGKLAGRQLQYVHSGVEEFYNWAAFHPETEIHGAAGSATAARPARSGRAIELMPAPIYRVVKRGWWTPGMSMLDIGCGDGLIAAWLAEIGLDVLGVDPSSEAIARARKSFRGLTRLAFETADLRRPVPFSRLFDAVVDHGYLSRLAPGERATYASTVAAAAKPGARFLLLVPLPLAAFERRKRDISQFFRPAFRLVAAQPTGLSRPSGDSAPEGAAFCLVRQ
jgi:SAM-dependent methyltransferase